MGGAFGSPLTSLGPVGDRLGGESCFRQVMGDEFWLGLSDLWELCLKHLRNLLVILLSRAFQE